MARLLLLLALLAPHCHADDHLYDLIRNRLDWMQQVAAWKWHRGLPIENLEREAVVIERAVETGLQYGITTSSAREFFTAQIHAAKAIQSCWFDHWHSASPPQDVADLNDIVRPALLELGDDITRLLVQHAPDRRRFDEIMQVDCLPQIQHDAIFSALSGIRRYPDRLTQIREAGQLRVGTTGDYAPFSFSGDGRDFAGIDIDMARDLAASLQAELVLVHTSWPTLMEDLREGRFDVAMSGVSIIPARQQQAYFSNPYHVGGKTPITRCDTVKRFSSLDVIDQPGVTLVVNPGGTNERFVRTHIHEATVLVHPDNRTIFDLVIGGEADLMITDSIEVTLQAARNAELCASMPGETLTYQEKGYMMPPDEKLQQAVNDWLESARTSGELARAFQRHLR